MTRIYILLIVVLYTSFGCTSENAPECFRKSGKLIREEIVVEDFSKITVFEGVKLVVKQETEQRVEIETGELLRNDVTVEVLDGRLIMRNESGCNLVRDFGLTTVYISSPNISEIRSSTGLLIKSDGVLTYPSLSLLSESYGVPEADTTDGEFDIEVNNTTVSIVSNGIAYFKIKGATQNFSVNFAAGDSRLEAKELIANDVNVNHRGSNDMLVNPQQSLKGIILGTGDVISYNVPVIVEVTELYKGRLIFNND
tara:strand:- start:5568 stop:6329 length:762 start_codon:yes stop_codon:yes gene_type:complete